MIFISKNVGFFSSSSSSCSLGLLSKGADYMMWKRAWQNGKYINMGRFADLWCVYVFKVVSQFFLRIGFWVGGENHHKIEDETSVKCAYGDAITYTYIRQLDPVLFGISSKSFTQNMLAHSFLFIYFLLFLFHFFPLTPSPRSLIQVCFYFYTVEWYSYANIVVYRKPQMISTRTYENFLVVRSEL